MHFFLTQCTTIHASCVAVCCRTVAAAVLCVGVAFIMNDTAHTAVCELLSTAVTNILLCITIMQNLNGPIMAKSGAEKVFPTNYHKRLTVDDMKK